MKTGPLTLDRPCSDTGIGMEKNTLGHIFEPFFTTKGPEKGTGLGLATVYGIVEAKRPCVWAHSGLSQGSTFSVYLPTVGEKTEPREHQSKGRETMRGSETILLVEDAALLRGHDPSTPAKNAATPCWRPGTATKPLRSPEGMKRRSLCC